ncbi:Golgi-associated plant pathogenesis-related protein 1 [Galendromus occidentalis]|uniref:Golgi-associated plant pathogenesis-related protein 1 n=1 Tax=Galendromus occidentalis TaxID=34638 RepID=A0AAJ6VW69_9ACAR|nr:Golgi-associated plant pathogenesis-related protein 1 [Galendromus occidentalis]
MAERRQTSVMTEYKDGMKIVTTTTIVTTRADAPDRDEALEKRAAVLDRNNIADPSPAPPKEDFQKKALERHNHYRSKHGVPPLEWCSKCAAKAQAHADHMAQTNNFSHSTEKGFGENLFNSSSSRGPDINADKAVDSWYNEISEMKFGQPAPSNFSQVGHFTQVVWKETTHVGMAYAVKGNSVFVVANYLPPGNFVGKFHENVFPPKN